MKAASIPVLVTVFCAATVFAQPARQPGRKRGAEGAKWTESQSAANRDQARAALREGRVGDAARWVTMSRGNRSPAEVDEWRLIEAEVHLAGRAFAKAGLAGMRVVILSPKSLSIGEALYLAGRAYEGLDRPGKAIELYRECTGSVKARPEIIEKARERLTSLEKKASTP